jgi:heavy metal sensor kinase
MARELDDLHQLSVWLAVLGGGILMLGLTGGWWLTTRAIQPIAEISAAATRIAEGDLSHRINSAETASELGQLASVLNSTFARLEAAFARQQQFTADASHELRTPVAIVLSQTQATLARERSPVEYRETLQACERAAQRMRALTESLLTLARFDAGHEPTLRERVDLGRLVKDSLDLFNPLAKERRIAVHSDLTSVECLGDPQQLTQVVANLITNALVHNRCDGEVRVTVRGDSAWAILTVADKGPGISSEDLPRIFERFYRGDKSRTAATGGTGLGLAIGKAIVERHRGTLEVASVPGAGCTFTVRLPVGSS